MLTEKQKWGFEVARNRVVACTKVFEETFIDVFKLIEDTDMRITGFDIIRDMRAARDELMTFINALDGVEYKKREESKMQDSANTKMAHAMAEEPTGRYLARLVKSAEPMVVIAGPAPGMREGRPGPQVVGDSAELLERTAHVRARKETMMEFYARTGIGAHQVRTLSKAELTSLVETVSANATEDVQPPTSAFRPLPHKFVLEA